MLGAGNSGALAVARRVIGHARRAFLARLDLDARRGRPTASTAAGRARAAFAGHLHAVADRRERGLRRAVGACCATTAAAHERRSRAATSGSTTHLHESLREKCSAAAGRKPNSVSAFASPLRRELRRTTTIPLGPALLAGSSDLPGGFGRAVLFTDARDVRRCVGASLFGLAPCGVLPAICLTADAVRSYRTFSPLPAFALAFELGFGGQARLQACPPSRPKAGEGGRYIFCATVLRVAPTGSYPAHCPVEFGLSSRLRLRASARQPCGACRARRRDRRSSGPLRRNGRF